MGRIIGIDLGTTNSLAAHWTGDGPRVIPLPEGDTLLPSVVGMHATEGFVIGKAARLGIDLAPENTIASVKRTMGSDRLFLLGGTWYRPQDVSALIIKEICRAAEIHLGGPIDRAVVTVPAYFNDPQRQATKDAGEIAGLHVERLLSEPTAAALAYGIDHLDADARLMVCDLGGGTFDVSILETFEGIMDVRACAGDSHLGGDDFDETLVRWLLAEIQARHRVDLRANSGVRAILRKAAEAAKIRLSDAESTEVRQPLIAGATTIDVAACIDRRQFEEMARPLLERIRTCVRRALADARASRESLAEVILVGGATRMPMVRRLLEEELGRAARDDVNPMHAVALGAAIESRRYDRHAPSPDAEEQGPELVLTDVCPFTLGVATLGVWADRVRPGVFSPIIPRNSPVPVARTERFYTVRPDQEVAKIEVYQGEDPLVENNVLLDRYMITGVQPGPDGSGAIDVSFTYNANGILEVKATVVATGRSAGMRIERSKFRMSSTEIAQSRSKIDAAWHRAQQRRMLREAIASLEQRLAQGPNELRAKLALRLAAAREALAAADAAAIQERLAELTTLLEGLAADD